MSFALVVRPAAERDVAEARDWYEDQRGGLGSEFLTAVEDVFARIREWPEMYAVEYRGVRRARVNRFPYVVYYRLVEAGVQVIAVMHGSRDPRAWRSRA